MAAAASDPRRPASRLADLIAHHPPIIEPAAGHSCSGGTHSRTRDARIVCWNPPAAGFRVAVDAEVAGQAVPGPLARRWGTGDPGVFWRWWTATEVAAKLVDEPIMAWVSNSPPVTENPVRARCGTVWWSTGRTQGLQVTHGLLEPSEGLS